MPPAQQHVVGVAGLGADAYPPGRRPDRMHDDSLPDAKLESGRLNAKGEIGVLPVGARKAFVESTDGLQRRAAVHHVGGDPLGTAEAGDVAFPVGRETVRRHWHVYSSLAAADCRWQ
jgi:hypothetical protein